MRLTESERALIEQVLDEAFLATSYTPAQLARFAQALAIVRPRRVGERKLRSDFNLQRRDKRQADCVGDLA